MHTKLDQQAYQHYQRSAQVENNEESTDYQRYILSAYPYFRARLLVPGRNHSDDASGSIAIGGSAHIDLIDLDIWLSKQSAKVRLEALYWIRGTSLEQTAYWRGMGKSSRSTIKRRRDKIVRNLAENATKLSK
jgi:hypothetical protein